MPLRYHALNKGGPSSGFVVNRTLSDVDARDEKCRLEALSSELVEYIFSVYVRSVIVGNSNSSRFCAEVNSLSSISDRAKLRTSDVARAASRREMVSITSWSVLEETIGGLAVVVALATPSLKHS